ncbi:unnamed protein product, partial [Larinioides sclopetarius]
QWNFKNHSRFPTHHELLKIKEFIRSKTKIQGVSIVLGNENRFQGVLKERTNPVDKLDTLKHGYKHVPRNG